MEYLILILILPLSVIFLVDIFGIINNRKNDREYKEYIDSIKVGDIFQPNFENAVDDPFEEAPDYSEYSKVIVDIKENNKGETWIKYKWLKVDNGIEYTEELHKFLETQTRIADAVQNKEL